MAVTAVDRRPNLTPLETYRSRKRDEAREPEREADQTQLDPELEIARYCTRLYEEGVRARRPYETFDTAWDLFVGNMFPASTPRWKATIVINKIAAYILFMQAVMTDNKPRIQVDPLVPGTEDSAALLRKLVDRIWDQENVQDVLGKAVLYGLIWGTGIVKTVYNPRGNNGRGKYEITPIVPYRVYTNPTATCIEDAEYVVHVEQRTLGWIRRNYPEKANVVATMVGKRYRVGDDETSRDYIREGYGDGPSTVYSAQNINGTLVPPQQGAEARKYDDDNDQVEVVEYWFRDDKQDPFQEQVVKNGVPQMRDVVDADGLPELEVVGHQTALSEIDGLPFSLPIVKVKREPVMATKYRSKYPNGRLCVMAGPVVLRDIPNPFQTNGFPFAMWKDIDVDAFWGMGEAIRLKDCNIGLNRLVSQLYDIIEKTGNPSYRVKKGGGFDPRSLKNRAGQIIPLDEIENIKPLEQPQFPNAGFELASVLKNAMAEVSGLQDSVMGASPGANTAFATVDQLQESGSAPLRQKVRNMERMIQRMGQNLIALIQQFDTGETPLRDRREQPMTAVAGDDGEEAAIVQPMSETDFEFKKYKPTDLQGAVEFKVVPVSSLSTSPAGKWARMTELFKLHLIDAQWFHETFQLDGWKQGLSRMQMAQAQQTQAKAQAKKPGPAPSNNRRSPSKPQPPLKQSVTRESLSAIR